MKILERMKQFFDRKVLEVTLIQIDKSPLRKYYEGLAEVHLTLEILRKGELKFPFMKEINRRGKVFVYLFVNYRPECPYPFKIKLCSFTLRYKNDLRLFHAYIVVSLERLTERGDE